MAEQVGSAEEEKGPPEKIGLSKNAKGAEKPLTALDQTLQLLKAKDDTSRFVGLSLLRTLLDSQPDLQKDLQVINRCWNAISPKFLDRMLKAKANEKRDQKEADAMVTLAIAVLHHFAILLSLARDGDEKLTGRVGGLIGALERSSVESKLQILQTLFLIVHTEAGSHVLFGIEDWSPLIKVAPQQEMALDVMEFTFLNIFGQIKDQSSVYRKLDTTVIALLACFQEIPDVYKPFTCLKSIILGIPFQSSKNPFPWMVPLGEFLRQTILKGQPASRQAALILAATLIHRYPCHMSLIMFDASEPPKGNRDSTPFLYLFVQLLLVDIKSSIPSLQEILNSSDYLSTSERLAACYDLVSAFISQLLSNVDNQDTQNEIKLPLAPNILLELRKDISETVSLTIEHLRDRYDASIGGAPGLHPEAKSTVPAIAWDSSTTSITKDPLPVSQVGTLALWLGADENDSLQREAAGITEVLLYLYSTSESAGYKTFVPIALEPIVATSVGIEAFLSAEGWAIFVKELPQLLASPSEADSVRGTDIVRVLLNVVEAEETGPAREEWMTVIETAVQGFEVESGDLDLKIAVAQLAVEVLVKAPRGLRRRHEKFAKDLLRLVGPMTVDPMLGNDVKRSADTIAGLEEVMTALKGLGLGG